MNWMKVVVFALLVGVSWSSWAQPGGSGEQGDTFLPGAIYEVRYWTDMTGRTSNVLIDTMIFFNDRAAFNYTQPNCPSCAFEHTNSIIYSVMPSIQGNEKDIIVGNSFVKKMNSQLVKFRNYERMIYKIYASDLENKNTGTGEYSLVSAQFGVIYRYNNRGEVWMLNRIDVFKDGKSLDEIDLLPLQVELNRTRKIFTEGD